MAVLPVVKFLSNRILLVFGWILTVSISFLIGLKITAPSEDTREGTTFRSSESIPNAREAKIPESKRTRSERSLKRKNSSEHEQVIAEILSSTTGTTKTRQLLELVDSLSPAEFPDFVESFRDNPVSSIHQAEYQLILKAWVDLDPYGAVSHIEANDMSGGARRTVMRAWAAADPYAALSKAKELNDAGRTNDWTVGLAAGLAASDPESAMTLLEGLQPGRTLNASINAVVPHVLQEGFEHTSGWLLGITDEEVRGRAVRVTARGLANMELERSGTWVAGIPDVALRRNASEEVASLWAQDDLEAARVWAESLPEDTRTEAAEGIAREMVKTDPQGTADWLVTMGDNPDLDGARRLFLDSVQNSHPEIALASVPSLSDENLHTRYYRNILTRWERQDQSAALNWVADNVQELPESVLRRYYPSE